MKRSQLILMVVVVVGAIVGLSIVTSLANQVNYAVLFSGMTSSDAGDVYNKLQELGVDVKAEGDGTILVPKEQVNQLTYQLNAEGYPKSGLNFDFYTQNATSFGMTDQDKRLYLQFQLEQNISQTINQMEKIKSSTVMITLPQKSSYVLSGQNNAKATASVVLDLRDGQTLTANDAATIRAVVSKSVENLAPEDITIADSKMNTYSANGLSGDGTGAINQQLELQAQVAEKLRQQILNLLTPVFGAEKLSASVNVLLNFDKSTTNSITLAPPVDNGDNTGLIVSMKETEEKVANGTTATEGQPGQVENGGGAVTNQAVESPEASGNYSMITKEINAEVNQINQQLEKAQGTIQDLSATVIIDGGDDVKALLPDLKKQIATAIGVSEDKITVSNMSFAQNTQYQQTLTAQQEAVAKMQQGQMIQALIIAAAIVAVALIIIGTLRASARRKRLALELENELQMQQFNANALPYNGAVDVIADEELSIEDLMEKDKNNTLGQLQGLVQKDSEMIAQLLRNWLSDDYRR